MMPSDKPRARVLIVDDNPVNIDVLRGILSPHMRVLAALDAPTAQRLARGPQPPDLVLLDVNMPGMNGYELCEQLRHDVATREIPVIFVTARTEDVDESRGFAVGGSDYITKPVHPDVVLARARTQLELRTRREADRARGQRLERLVRVRTGELERAYDELWRASLETTVRLARAAEFRDDDTGAHVLRMSHFATTIARSMGLPEPVCEQILHAAPLHDIGKIGIPDRILLKKGPLDEGEWAIMRRHPLIGARVLDGSDNPVVQLAEVIARTHHERWDGTGYPEGLAGEAIPLVGRIVAVADVFDALTNARPYKPAFPVERAVSIIREGAGSHFQPAAVQAFLAVLDELVHLRLRFQRSEGDPLLGRLVQRPSR
jgi:putative two-component system response regulator